MDMLTILILAIVLQWVCIPNHMCKYIYIYSCQLFLSEVKFQIDVTEYSRIVRQLQRVKYM